jgi:hypothetical protein
MLTALNDPLIQQILPRSGNETWREDFQKIEPLTLKA